MSASEHSDGVGRFADLGLPGGALVDEGLADLACGRTSVASLLVSLAAPRLRREGVPVTNTQPDPELRLYRLLSSAEGELAYARYNAYLRLIVSFANSCSAVGSAEPGQRRNRDATERYSRPLFGFMKRLAEAAPRGRRFRVFVTGGGTAVAQGWRGATIDVDLYAVDEAVFRDIQRIKETEQVNVEFARPEHFVPPLAGAADRHLFIATFGGVSFLHYDPYSQVFSKVVRGFPRDLLDASHFIAGGLVDAVRLRELVDAIPESAFAKYPALSRDAVRGAVAAFLDSIRPQDLD